MSTLWVIINILVPLALPSVGPLPILQLPATAITYRAAVLITVKDGQLCWGVIAMGLSTTYELAEAAVGGRSINPSLVAALFAALFTMLFSVTVAAAGAFFPVTVPKPPLISWVAHYKAFVASLGMAVVTACAFAYVQFMLHAPMRR